MLARALAPEPLDGRPQPVAGVGADVVREHIQHITQMARQMRMVLCHEMLFKLKLIGSSGAKVAGSVPLEGLIRAAKAKEHGARCAKLADAGGKKRAASDSAGSAAKPARPGEATKVSTRSGEPAGTAPGTGKPRQPGADTRPPGSGGGSGPTGASGSGNGGASHPAKG